MLCTSEIIIEKKGLQGTLSQIIVKVSHQTFGMIHTQTLYYYSYTVATH